MTYNMMGYAGGMPFFPFFGLGNLITLIGVVLLIAWAIHHLPAPKLKIVGLWFVGIGLLLSLLTGLLLMPYGAPIRGNGLYNNSGNFRRNMMFQQGQLNQNQIPANVDQQ